MAKILTLLFILCLLLSDAAAQGFRKSRGGGPTRSTDWSSRSKPSTFHKSSPTRRYTTGSKSSRVNVHQKHARTAASEDTRPQSRSEAERAARTSTPAVPRETLSQPRATPNYFEAEPHTRPADVPPAIKRENSEYPVVFHDHRYGYWQKGPQGLLFVPLLLSTTQPGVAQQPGVPAQNVANTDDANRTPQGVRRYERPLRRHEDALPGWFDLLSVLLFFGVMVAAILLVLRATQSRRRATPMSAESQTNVARETAAAIPTTPVVSGSLWDKLYHTQRGQMATLSDPMTLEHFQKPSDFQVTEALLYTHATFTLRRVDLRHAGGGQEELELSLLLKEVEGDYCLFLGMLDHEGRNRDLMAADWFHLDSGGDRFAGAFHSIFPGESEGVENKVMFVQHEFGAFYDISDGKRKTIGICEYYPQNAPAGFDWQHAIVIWQGDWLRCYYCREIHERNVEVFS